MNTRTIRRLQKLLGLQYAASPIDWSAVEEELQSKFPASYRELAESFPPGEYQTFFKVLHPTGSRKVADFRAEVAEYAQIVRDWAQAQPAPISVYPAARGLVPWATVGFDYTLCWRPGEGEPDTWPTVICSAGRGPWPVYEMTTQEFLIALLSEPATISELSYVTEAVQPPHFTALDGERAPIDTSLPGYAHWLDGLLMEDLHQLARPVAELSGHIEAAPLADFDRYAFLEKVRRTLPDDFCKILELYGAARIGPARVSAPDGSEHDFFAESTALAKRVKAERKAGRGPLGTVHPESQGLILWGRLDNGGYLCWAQTPGGRSRQWPVVALDASLRHHVTYPMSTSQFLYELAINPDGVELPSA
ncbi:SMI1/KNR4 family protein [Actinoplanes sp. NPDC051859]|uniref:SMI1/KNR4 family protein n=1 Tax=Actinoplanes sp. NPDC051859 TaxID=3363909 RepID=UPI0037B5AEB1